MGAVDLSYSITLQHLRCSRESLVAAKGRAMHGSTHTTADGPSRGDDMWRKMAISILGLLCLFVCGCSIGAPERLRGTWQRFTQADGLGNSWVDGVAVDGKGNTWFATMQGVSVLSPRGDWTYYRAEDGLGADWARDIVADKRGRIWVATGGGGVSRFDGTGWQTFNSANSNLHDDYVARLAVDSQDNVWVLSSEGVSVIHDDGSTSYVGAPFSQSAGGTLTIDPNGHIWVASRDYGALSEYDPGKRRWSAVGKLTERVALPAKEVILVLVWDIAADRQEGHLWMAASSIVEVEGETWRVHLSEYSPWSIFVDPEGYRWFGLQDGGLLLLSPDSQQWWYCRGGLNCPEISDWRGIFRITRDSQGNYWFMDGYGVVRFTPDK